MIILNNLVNYVKKYIKNSISKSTFSKNKLEILEIFLEFFFDFPPPLFFLQDC